ncbi:MAG TPA: DUF4136 domain-containing protein [Pyrinomonadaceae bacterium]|nr:DUF4136 domain-containing protein [Pyrinomonadaceae bacterium]
MKPFKSVFHGAALAALLLFAGDCLGQDVRFNFLPANDFSKYKTYRWVDVEGADYSNKKLDGQIKEAIDLVLSKKGLTRSDAASTDLLLTYQLGITKATKWHAYSSGEEYWGWGGWGGWGENSGKGETVTIEVGTMNLDFYDVALKKQVWRGEATKTVNRRNSESKIRRNLGKAVGRLLKNYPPLVLK